MHAAVAYWTDKAREQNHWATELRAQARTTSRCRESGRLYDARRRCLDRRAIFMAEARRMAAEVRRIAEMSA